MLKAENWIEKERAMQNHIPHSWRSITYWLITFTIYYTYIHTTNSNIDMYACCYIIFNWIFKRIEWNQRTDNASSYKQIIAYKIEKNYKLNSS